MTQVTQIVCILIFMTYTNFACLDAGQYNGVVASIEFECRKVKLDKIKCFSWRVHSLTLSPVVCFICGILLFSIGMGTNHK